MTETNEQAPATATEPERPTLLSRFFALFRGGFRTTGKAPARPSFSRTSGNSFALSDYAQEGMAVLREFRPIFCNASFAYMLGSTQEQLAQTDINSFIHAEDRCRFSDAEKSLSRPDEASSRFLIRFVTLPGDLRWGACSMRPILWEGESAILLYALDVTDMRKEQQEKEGLYAGFRAIMDYSPAGIALFDAFGSLREANPRWREMWSTPDTHANVLYGNLSFTPALTRAFSEAFTGKEKTLPSLELQAPWGDVRRLHIGLYPLTTGDDKVIGLLMMHEDITENVRHTQAELEHAARSAQARYELLRMRDHVAAVMDATPSVMIGIDEAMVVTLWNSAAERRYDLSRRNALGQPLTSVCRPLARHEALIEKALREKVSSQFNLMPYTEHGRIEYEDMTVYPIETNLETGAIIRVDNVTKRMRLENDLAQADRFSSVGMLASGMAHEINNPLSAILQGVQNLERRLLTELPVNAAAALALGTTFKSVQSYVAKRQVPMLLQQMRGAGDRIARIVSNMLHFSRQRDMVLAPIKVSTLVREALDLASTDGELKEMIDFSAITVHFDPAEDLLRINCSETEIVQVLLQILRILVYSMQRRPAPPTKPSLHIDIFPEDDYAAIAIRSPDSHLPPEVCKRIFEPFYTTHGMGQGSNGIGLSLAFFIVTSVHKGSMLCESSPDLGSVFTVRLPLANQ